MNINVLSAGFTACPLDPLSISAFVNTLHVVSVEILSGQGCRPGWVDCTSTLSERILSLSTTSASGSIIFKPLKDAGGLPFGKADGLYLYLHVQKLCAEWESTNTSVSFGGSVEGCCRFSIWRVCLQVHLLKVAAGSPIVKCVFGCVACMTGYRTCIK